MDRSLKPLKLCTLLLTVGMTLAWTGCVTTGSFRQFEEEVRVSNESTRETLEEIREAFRKTQKDQANIKADMIDLHTEFQQLTGDVTSDQHSSTSEAREREAMEASLGMQLSQILAQLQFQEARMARVEKYLGLKPLPPPARPSGARGSVAPPPGAGLEPPAVTGTPPEGAFAAPAPEEAFTAPAPPPVKSNPEEAYEVASRLFKAKKYEGARSAFEQFLRDYPKSSLAGNALFWIGETYYNAGKFDHAIVKYQEVLEKSPKGSKAPDSLLKMGLSLEKMGEIDAAVAAFKKLQQDYPTSSQVELARKKTRELRQKPKTTGKEKGR